MDGRLSLDRIGAWLWSLCSRTTSHHPGFLAAFRLRRMACSVDDILESRFPPLTAYPGHSQLAVCILDHTRPDSSRLWPSLFALIDFCPSDPLCVFACSPVASDEQRNCHALHKRHFSCCMQGDAARRLAGAESNITDMVTSRWSLMDLISCHACAVRN
jgi:hypothetical protein